MTMPAHNYSANFPLLFLVRRDDDEHVRWFAELRNAVGLCRTTVVQYAICAREIAAAKCPGRMGNKGGWRARPDVSISIMHHVSFSVALAYRPKRIAEARTMRLRHPPMPSPRRHPNPHSLIFTLLRLLLLSLTRFFSKDLPSKSLIELGNTSFFIHRHG
jgi:hypothetical protein